MKKYIVELTSKERCQLGEIINVQRMAAHKRRHARMVLKLDQGCPDPGWSDAQAAAAFDCTSRSAERLRRRLVERGLDAALEHGNRGSYRAWALDGVAEAHLIALACSVTPKGHNRWTIRLLRIRWCPWGGSSPAASHRYTAFSKSYKQFQKG